MSSRAAFLIVAAAVVFHLSFLQTFIILIGYFGFASLDHWLTNRTKGKLIDDELFGWERNPDDSEWETKGNLSRVKLASKEQVVVTRVAELLRIVSS